MRAGAFKVWMEETEAERKGSALGISRQRPLCQTAQRVFFFPEQAKKYFIFWREPRMSSTLSSTKKITYSAMFAAIAIVVMFFEFPLPFCPPFLKVDLSGAVSLLAAFMFGPVSAVLITMVKDIVHAFSSSTGCVGELGDFFMTSAFCVTASLLYRRHHTKKGAILGMACGTLAMTIVGCFTNRYLLIPFFANVMPIEAILSACSSVNPLIGSVDTYILFGAVPFNLVKGTILSLITLLLYKRLSSFIRENTIGKRVDKVSKAS